MEREEFEDVLNAFLNKEKKACIFTVGAEVFVEGLYLEILQDKPKNPKKWLAEKLQSKFLCLSEPPIWRGEPDWPFYKGEPMIFMTQTSTSLEKNKELAEYFPIGDTVYVFSSKNPPKPQEGESWNTVYKIVIQDNEGGYTEEANYCEGM
nr:hypothetical protein [Pseudomonas sp. LPH1]